MKISRTIGLLALAALVGAAPAAVAKTKSAKAKKPAEATVQKVDTNEASWRIIKEAVPFILPTALLPVYFSAREDDHAKKKKK